MEEVTQALYPALVHYEDDGQVSIAFPDLEGCFASGKNLKDAYFNAQQALAIYAIYKKTLNAPSDISAITVDEDNTTVTLIGIDTNHFNAKDTESVKKTLSIPKWLNDIAMHYGVNFSAILKKALIAHLLEREDINEMDWYTLNILGK